MYYWNFAYTFAVRGTRPGIAEYETIDTAEENVVASNFHGAMERFLEVVKAKMSANTTVCDIAVVRGEVARVL